MSSNNEKQLGQYGIVYLLPESAKNYHIKLRYDIETKFNLIGRVQLTSPSHITMKYRFEADCIAEVEKILNEFSNTQAITPWSLKGFNHFINLDHRTIFIDVIPSQETRIVHARLLDCLKQLDWMQWGEYDHANLHYHVTVANQGLNENNFQAVWEYIHQYPQPDFDLFFDNIALLKIESEIHSVYKQYNLKDESSQQRTRKTDVINCKENL